MGRGQSKLEAERPAEGRFTLERAHGRLQLMKLDEPGLGPIYADFKSKTNEYRRKYGGGRRQAIAKAVGLRRGAKPLVVDATAGLGNDAFVLASLGCRVHMIERSKVVAALLEDGLSRATREEGWISEKMSFEAGDSRKALKSLSFRPDVVYLDPMFPHRKKSALARKEMRVFQHLLGPDPDAEDLLEIALKAAKERVVVKRPAYADWLGNRPPQTTIRTAKHRFDIYLV